MATKVFRIFYVLVIAGAILTAAILSLSPKISLSSGNTSHTGKLVQTDDFIVRSRAAEITKGCTSKESAAYKLFKHVISEEIPENMLVTLASYFENIGIPTRFVSSEGHTYVLGCGLSKSALFNEIINDLPVLHNESIRIAGGQMWVKSPVPELQPETKVNLAVIIEASLPIDVYLLESARGLDLSGHLAEIRGQQNIRHIFSVKPGNVVAITTSGTTKLDVKLALADITESNMAVMYFRNNECLPFDPLAGKSWIDSDEISAYDGLRISQSGIDY